MCTEELLELEPLLDDEELPLELPEDEEEEDEVLSSSLSTSRFLRGLSLTPPRRGLSLMPRLSIVYVGRRRMVGMGIGAVRLSCPSWLSRRGCRGCVGQQHSALGLGKAWPTDGLLSRGLASAETVFAGYRAALTVALLASVLQR